MKIWSLTHGSFALGKDYEVFDAIGHGREAGYAPEDQDPTHVPKFPPRGMPMHCSPEVAEEFFMLVVPTGERPNPYFWPLHRCVDPVTAGDWVRQHGVLESEVIQWFNCDGRGDITWRVVAEPHF